MGDSQRRSHLKSIQGLMNYIIGLRSYFEKKGIRFIRYLGGSICDIWRAHIFFSSGYSIFEVTPNKANVIEESSKIDVREKKRPV